VTNTFVWADDTVYYLSMPLYIAQEFDTLYTCHLHVFQLNRW